jgi:hypothetical protein
MGPIFQLLKEENERKNIYTLLFKRTYANAEFVLAIDFLKIYSA